MSRTLDKILAVIILLFATCDTYAQGVFFFGMNTTQFDAWDVGFNFRSTSGYVTDPSFSTYETFTGSSSFDYAANRTIINGQLVGYGWESCTSSGVSAANRSAYTGNEAVLAGIGYVSNVNSEYCIFRVDLPSAGTYNIRAALGDAAAGNAQNTHIVILDTNTQVADLSKNSTTTTFADATGTLYTPANWVTSNSPVSVAFTTTIFRFKIGNVTDSNVSAIATLRITRTQPSAALGLGTLTNGQLSTLTNGQLSTMTN